MRTFLWLGAATIVLVSSSRAVLAASPAACQPPSFVPAFQCDAARPQVKEERGTAAEFCSRFPSFCRAERPYGCRPTDPCNWHCETYDACGRLGALCDWTLSDAPEGSVAGGRFGILAPISNSHVGRRIEVVGFAHEFFGLLSLSFAFDGKAVIPVEYSSGFCLPETCRPPLGFGHFACRVNSGFRAVLELGARALAPGPHKLHVVVYDERGLPGVLELPLILDAEPQ